MIKVNALSKSFGDFQAVKQVSFEVAAGEVVGFLGPNGAGKSTTMKMLTGFLAPTGGSVSIMGVDVASDPIAVQRTIGYLPEGAPSYADMTVAASLKFVGQARGFSGSDLEQRIESVVGKLALATVLDRRIENLSKGFRRRLGLAQALIHDPQVLILDEPTDGLDPNQKHQVRELIKNLAKDKIVIVSTHILEEVSAVCSRAMILAEGTILFDGTPEALAARSDLHNAVVVELESMPTGVVAALEALDSVANVESQDNRLLVRSAGGANILKDVHEILNRIDANVLQLSVEAGRLDDVFRQLTSGGQQEVA